MPSPKVHIVIPVYNHADLIHNLLWQLQRKERKSISSILLVDDASTDPEIPNLLKWWASEYGSPFPIRVVTNKKNMGFLLSSNEGIRTVLGFEGINWGDVIILMSTDIKVMTEFIPQVTEILSQPKRLVGGVLYTHDTGWNRFGDKIFPYLEGWLLACTVDGWTSLGLFDERYATNDFEDIDLSTTALLNGAELVPLNNPGIMHRGGGSIGYGEDRLKQTNINKKKFEEKWCTPIS